MDQEENKPWRRKIQKEKKHFTKESNDANSYRYSLSGKNSYSFFSFDAAPGKMQKTEKKESKEYFFKPKTNKNKKRRKLKVKKKQVEVVKESSGRQDEAPLYTYSLSDEAGSSHAYFWSPGLSEQKKSKALHRAEPGAVRLGAGEESQTSRTATSKLLAEFRTQMLKFQHQSKLLTKIFLCKISRKFEFCHKI